MLKLRWAAIPKPAAAPRLALAPVRLLTRQLQHTPQSPRINGIFVDWRPVVRVVGTLRFEVEHLARTNEVQQILERIASGGSRHLVGKARRRERMVIVRNGTEPANSNVMFGRAAFCSDIRNRVRQIGQPHVVLETQPVAGFRVERRGNGRERRAREPRGWTTASVERGLVIHGRDGVVVVESEVVFAAPHDLHRLSKFLREHGRFSDIVRLRLTTEPAAKQRHVTDDVFLVDSQCRGDGVLDCLGILSRCPGCHRVVPELGDGRRWLHRRVGEMGCVVGRLQDLATLGKLLVDIAKIADRFSGLPDRVDQFFLEQLGVVAGVWTVVPVDFQLLAALEGRPGAVGNDGHPPQRLKHVRAA